MIKCIPNFLFDPDKARAHALASEFIDWQGQDGQVYKRICLTEVPGLRTAIESEMGPVNMLGMGYRLNYEGENPNAAIHSDIGWGTHALVLYLISGHSSTAFWKHKASGLDALEAGDQGALAKVENDWDNQEAWEMTGFVPMIYNGAVIYESKLFHSRYPFEGFGSTPEDGRLIAVAFFTPEKI